MEHYLSVWLLGFGLGILTGLFGTVKLARIYARKMRLEDALREYYKLTIKVDYPFIVEEG